MHHEQAARSRQGMEQRIKELETTLIAIQSDFAQCARGTSACYFCANDENCNCTEDKDCNFVWEKHN